MAKVKSKGKMIEEAPGKIITLIKLGKIDIKTEVSGTVNGEFPINEWRTFPLEIPSKGVSSHILGRFPASGIEPAQEDREVINLPVYTGEEIDTAGAFEAVSSGADESRALDNVPIITLSTKTCMRYPDGRKAQAISVLPIWNDSTSLLLELSWFEGNPEEDAVNPEWHIEATPKMSLETGLIKLKSCTRIFPHCSETTQYLYVNPAALGTHVLGEGHENRSKIWPREWQFEDQQKLLSALDKLGDVIMQMK